MSKLFIVGFCWELIKAYIVALRVRREEQRRSRRVVMETFAQVEREEITASRAAEICGMRMMDYRKAVKKIINERNRNAPTRR